jgi:hypothetical protein
MGVIDKNKYLLSPQNKIALIFNWWFVPSWWGNEMSEKGRRGYSPSLLLR